LARDPRGLIESPADISAGFLFACSCSPGERSDPGDKTTGYSI